MQWFMGRKGEVKHSLRVKGRIRVGGGFLGRKVERATRCGCKPCKFKASSVDSRKEGCILKNVSSAKGTWVLSPFRVYTFPPLCLIFVLLSPALTSGMAYFRIEVVEGNFGGACSILKFYVLEQPLLGPPRVRDCWVPTLPLLETSCPYMAALAWTGWGEAGPVTLTTHLLLPCFLPPFICHRIWRRAGTRRPSAMWRKCGRLSRSMRPSGRRLRSFSVSCGRRGPGRRCSATRRMSGLSSKQGAGAVWAGGVLVCAVVQACGCIVQLLHNSWIREWVWSQPELGSKADFVWTSPAM